jgi:hypothetical protein
MEFYKPLLSNIADTYQKIEAYKKSENFNQNNNNELSNAGKSVIGAMMMILILYIVLFGLWIWNIIVLIQNSKNLPTNIFTTCVILTILSVLTSLPLHIISLILIYVYNSKSK